MEFSSFISVASVFVLWLVYFVRCLIVEILLLFLQLFTDSIVVSFDLLPCISMQFCKCKRCFIFPIFCRWFVSFLFSGILLRIFLRYPGMLLLQDLLLMSFNLVLFKSWLIKKFNGVSRCKQLGVEKLLSIEKSIVVMSWDFSLKFSVAIFL